MTLDRSVPAGRHVNGWGGASQRCLETPKKLSFGDSRQENATELSSKLKRKSGGWTRVRTGDTRIFNLSRKAFTITLISLVKMRYDQ